jgi:hypothetical protein
MNYFLNRLREPSTWSGIGILVSLLGVPATTFGLVQQCVMAGAGLIAIAFPEKPAA